MSTIKAKQGFTLIELSLATVFLAVLLLIIATITISVSTIYQKGLSLRNVNATGRILIDDIQRSISSAPLLRMRGETIFLQRMSQNNVRIRDESREAVASRVQLGGVFCSGKYSYVWNTGYVLNHVLNPEKYEGIVEDPIELRIDGQAEPMTPYLAKFSDPDRNACEVDFGQTRTINIDTNPEELLSQTDGQIRLALYEMTIFPVVQDEVSWRSFYSGTFVLATLTGDVDIKSSGDYCKIENTQSLAGDFSYCAVNKFNFAAQASGK